MTYETYVLILCTIVYVALTLVTIAVITALTKMTIRLIRHGAEDKEIVKDYIKARKKGCKKKGKVVDMLFSIFLCTAFAVIFGFSLYVNINEDQYFDNIPTLKVVQSASMSKKHEKNKYLTENNLNNQFDTFDIILVYKAPAEEDLKLYDIVVYEIEFEGEVGYVVHRIVGIEEANEKHGRLFKTQGDAVESADGKRVDYSQIKAIYRDERVPFIGSFVLFMQSPAGWMCMILMLAATIATPIIDKILEKARAKRLAELLAKKQTERAAPACAPACAPTFAPPVYLYPVYYDPTKLSCPVQPPMQGKKKGDKQ